MKIYNCITKNDIESEIVKKSNIREFLYLDNLTLDNIYYCELSGLYDIWKHSKEDIVGIEHYRRFFIENDFNPIKDVKKYKILEEEKINEILKTNDIILTGQITNTTIMKFIINEKHNINLPKSFRPQINEVIIRWLSFLNCENSEFIDIVYNNYFKNNWFFSNNMFICKKEIIDEYCSWLFDMLNKFNNDILKNKKINRVFGYLSEWILGIWCQYKKLKIYDTSKICFDKQNKSEICDFLCTGSYPYYYKDLFERYSKK